MADVMNVGVNLEAFSQAINAIQALRSSVTRVFDSLKDGMKNKETLEGREKVFITEFQDNLQSVNRDLNELERLSTLVGRPSESHPLHNSGLLSLDPVQDKTPLYSQLLQAYKWSNKLDIWSKSNYQAFQKVTDHATTALLHYQLPQMPDVVVRSFMTWLRSYIKLFQNPCQRCGKFLQEGLPPTWRDFRTLEAFHDTCRQ
ncbi:unnamed protein product [Leuciscus chuanchicus]